MNTFNYGQNYNTRRYICEVKHPIINILCIPHYWYWNDTPGQIHIAHKRENILGENFNRIIIFETNRHKKIELNLLAYYLIQEISFTKSCISFFCYSLSVSKK